MKSLFAFIIQHIQQFLGTSPSTSETNEDFSQPFQEIIQLALYKKAAIHVIYEEGSFTGDIVRYDPQLQRLVLKNFSKNMSKIIHLDDICRISIVPDSVRISQKADKV